MDTIHHSHNAPMQWADDAACIGAPPGIFYPLARARESWANHPDAVAAKAICATCPVAADCLEWAIFNEADGIWGGTDPAERVELRRDRGIRIYFKTPDPLGDPNVDELDDGHRSARQIASILGISPRTVARHRAADRA
jgi:WhiB family redox-sensing transcriptional regulator